MPETPDLTPIMDEAFGNLVLIIKASDNKEKIISQLTEIAKILTEEPDAR